MTDSRDDVILSVNGSRYMGWQSGRIVRSIERGAHAFDLSLTQSWQTGVAKVTAVKMGDAAEIHIGNDLVISGYVDVVLPSYDDKTHTVMISGRSKIGDLIDCSNTRKQYKSQTLLQIAKAECKPFNINVTTQADIGKAFTHTPTRDAGESIFEFLEQLARYRGLRLTSTPEGNLVFIQAGKSYAQTALVLGKNIKKGKGNFTYQDMFSDYTVLAQQPAGGFSLSAEAIAGPKATVKDLRINRFRPKVIQSQQPGDIQDCKNRAQWQRNTHYGRGRGVIYTVTAWRQKPKGPLWQANDLVQVNDVFIGINGERLITEVQFIIDDEGRRTEIKVMPKAAFEMHDLPEPKTETGAWG